MKNGRISRRVWCRDWVEQVVCTVAGVEGLYRVQTNHVRFVDVVDDGGTSEEGGDDDDRRPREGWSPRRHPAATKSLATVHPRES